MRDKIARLSIDENIEAVVVGELTENRHDFCLFECRQGGSDVISTVV